MRRVQRRRTKDDHRNISVGSRVDGVTNGDDDNLCVCRGHRQQADERREPAETLECSRHSSRIDVTNNGIAGRVHCRHEASSRSVHPKELDNRARTYKVP